MTTATANDLTLPLLGGRHHFLLRRLHSLTGIVFGGYLVVHLLVNATLAQGGQVYQIQVNKIHDLPFVWAVEWVFIFLPIIYHTVYGIWITFTAQWNLDRYPYEKNVFYVFQRISALILVLFIAFHIFAMRGLLGATLSFNPEQATKTVVGHMNAHWWIYPVYVIGILASCYHLSNGFWTAAITWGLTISAAAQRRWGWICAVLFVFTLTCGVLALGATIARRHAAYP